MPHPSSSQLQTIVEASLKTGWSALSPYSLIHRPAPLMLLLSFHPTIPTNSPLTATGPWEGHPEEDKADNGQAAAAADLKSVKGLGLGLYTAYHLVKLLGGKLRHSADAATNEACFWFSLPLETLVSGSDSGQRPGLAGKGGGQKRNPKMTFATLSACDQDQGVGTDTPKTFLSRQVTTEMGFEGGSSSGISSPKMTMRVLIVDDSAICQKVDIHLSMWWYWH